MEREDSEEHSEDYSPEDSVETPATPGPGVCDSGTGNGLHVAPVRVT